MQLARRLFHLNTRNIPGKIKQIGLALWLEARYSKKDLLEAYCNLAPMGGNTREWGLRPGSVSAKKPAGYPGRKSGPGRDAAESRQTGRFRCRAAAGPPQTGPGLASSLTTNISTRPCLIKTSPAVAVPPCCSPASSRSPAHHAVGWNGDRRHPRPGLQGLIDPAPPRYCQRRTPPPG